MSYPADPGGNFSSDVHRRVQALVPKPDEDALPFTELIPRLAADDHLHIPPDELPDVLKDLEADGDVTQESGNWKQTEQGFEVLTGPIADDGGRSHGA